jgi:hypothetical protein
MQKQDNNLPDIEPEEVNGLQNHVGILKSIRNRKKLTITDNPRNEYEWTLDDCIKKSRSFNVFCHDVHPDYYERLLPLCLELDFFLNPNSDDECLTFNIEKHGKSIIYKKLKYIWEDCFDDYTESKWYCNYIAQITNLADNGDSVRKGFDRS